MRIIELKDKSKLIFKIGVHGIGFEAVHSIKKEDKTERTPLFFTYDEEKWKSLSKQVEETKEIPEWPSTDNEVPPLKILVLRSKHYIGYYEVSTPQKLEIAVRTVLKNEQNYYYSPGTPPKNESDINSLEEIEKIPERFPNLRKEAKEMFEEYQKKLDEFNTATKVWNKLQDIIAGKGTLLEAMRVLEHYESGHYDIENVETFEI